MKLKHDSTDYLSDTISQLEALQDLTSQGYEFSVTEYNISVTKENLDSVTKMILSQRPEHTKIKLLAIRTG